jgi:putative two-component system response regulator
MAKILVVDDERGLRLSLKAFLTKDGYEVETAEDVPSAMDILEATAVDVVISDIIMPGESGVQLLARIHERSPGIAVILLTGEPNVETAAEAVRHGAFDYTAKPIAKPILLATVARAARAKAQYDENLRLAAENRDYQNDLEGLVERRTEELSVALRGTIGVLSQALEMRDPYTAGHQRRVATLSLALGKAMGLSEGVLEGVEMAAMVHDVGKIAVPADILSKPTRLSKAEFDIIKEHSTVGYEILKDVQFPWPLAEVVWQHHERLDGSGYPQGLQGDAIRLEARIIGVADVVEAMASHRPYRAALGIEVALEEITNKRGLFFDPMVVDACLRLFSEDGFQLES